MRVSQSGDYANVRLQWELVYKEDETQLGVPWRVSVRADRAIMSIQEIIRAASQKGAVICTTKRHSASFIHGLRTS